MPGAPSRPRTRRSRPGRLAPVSSGRRSCIAWPRKDVYNATEPFHWYLQYGAVLFIGVVFFGGLAYYWFVQRHKTGVLASHAFESASPAVPDEPAPAPAAGGAE